MSRHALQSVTDSTLNTRSGSSGGDAAAAATVGGSGGVACGVDTASVAAPSAVMTTLSTVFNFDDCGVGTAPDKHNRTIIY